MSCDDITGSEVLVYVRRTAGGGVNGVIYNWDYYQMASLPTNDNVRYQKPKNKNPVVALHEIGNNRYEDMVCKSTHIAYKIGGFSRSAPIPIGEAENQVDKKIETTDNKCVLLMVSSSNFYQRLPECWPWSCRRWTADISGYLSSDKQRKYKQYTFYTQDINGDKVKTESAEWSWESNVPDEVIKDRLTSVNSPLPIFTVKIKGERIDYTESKPVFKVGLNTYGSDITGFIDNGKMDTMPSASAPDIMAMNGSYYYEKAIATAYQPEPGKYDPMDGNVLQFTKCGSSTWQVKIAFELFPVLCNGVCKLVMKLGYKCANKDSEGKDLAASGGRSTKKLISPFWSCRINERIEMYDEDDETRPILNYAEVTLDGTDLKGKESFGEGDVNQQGILTVITGADYYEETRGGKQYRVPYNTCDGPTKRIYYSRNSGETFGKAQEYLGAGADCCKYCKTADEDGNITFSNNLYCSALDPECDGKPYGMYDDPCPKAGGSGSSDGGGTTNGGTFTSILMGGIGGGTGGSAGGGGYQGGGGDLGGAANFLFS